MISPTGLGVLNCTGHYGKHIGCAFKAKKYQDVKAPFNMKIERIIKNCIFWANGYMTDINPMPKLIGLQIKQGTVIGQATQDYIVLIKRIKNGNQK